MKAEYGFSRYVWLLGLSLPLAVVVGTRWYHPGPRDQTGASPGPADRSQVVCFGYADVEYGVISLHPSQAGRVAAVLVRENEEVDVGAALLRLDDHIAKLQVDEAEAALQAAQVQLAQAQKRPDEHRIKIARQQTAIRVAQQRLVEARHALAAKQNQQQIQDIGRYRPEPVVAEEIIAMKAKVAQMEALEQADEEQLKELELHDPEADVRRAKADVATMEARLQQARRTFDECTLTAPVAGTVLRIQAGPGHLLTPQSKQAAIEFCPRGERIIRVEVDQEFAGRVALGQPAVIADDVNDGSPWRGRVLRVSDWYTQRRLVTDDPLHLKDVRSLECLIGLDPGQPSLRIGQRVRVTIGPEAP
jgi:multidrug resistance efflux pump